MRPLQRSLRLRSAGFFAIAAAAKRQWSSSTAPAGWRRRRAAGLQAAIAIAIIWTDECRFAESEAALRGVLGAAESREGLGRGLVGPRCSRAVSHLAETAGRGRAGTLTTGRRLRPERPAGPRVGTADASSYRQQGLSPGTRCERRSTKARGSRRCAIDRHRRTRVRPRSLRAWRPPGDPRARLSRSARCG